MFVPAKTIPIHPDRAFARGDRFETPSGLGGSFTIVFAREENNVLHFIIDHPDPPPDGWDGQPLSIRREDRTARIHGIAPESPFLDDGAAELRMLRHLGYPEDSPEIIRVLTLTNRPRSQAHQSSAPHHQGHPSRPNHSPVNQ